MSWSSVRHQVAWYLAPDGLCYRWYHLHNLVLALTESWDMAYIKREFYALRRSIIQ